MANANQAQEADAVAPIAPPPVPIAILPWNRHPAITNSFNQVRMSDGTVKAQCKHCLNLMNPVSSSVMNAHFTKYCRAARARVNVE